MRRTFLKLVKIKKMRNNEIKSPFVKSGGHWSVVVVLPFYCSPSNDVICWNGMARLRWVIKLLHSFLLPQTTNDPRYNSMSVRCSDKTSPRTAHIWKSNLQRSKIHHHHYIDGHRFQQFDCRNKTKLYYDEVKEFICDKYVYGRCES